MINKEIRVTWVEFKPVLSPENPTESELEVYRDALEKSKIRQYGTILDFVTGFFSGTKAIIDCGNNKIVKVPIEKLTVVRKPKKK